MPLELVRIAILSDDASPAFVNGVAVRVYDAANNLITTALSGALSPGLVELELSVDASPVEFQLRFFKSGAAIAPTRIQVYSPALAAPNGRNEFAVTAQVYTLEPANDPVLCRASGTLLRPDRRAARNVALQFEPNYAAFVTQRDVQMTGRFTVRTDSEGFAKVDLYRNGIYTVMVEGYDDFRRTVAVPNRSRAHLSHLLFPVVVSVAYQEGAAVVVAAGASIDLHPQVRASDYRFLGVASDDVTYDVADPEIATVAVAGDHIVLTGLAAGSTTLRVTRNDNTIIYLPDTGVVGGELPVTVVP